MTFPGYPSYKRCEDKWINAIPDHWTTRPIKSIAKIDNSGYYGEEPDELACNFPVATTAQIDKNGSFSIEDMPIRSFDDEKSNRYLCKEGDILVVKSSGSATNIISGKAGIVRAEDKRFIFSNFLMRIKSDRTKILPTFLYYFIRSDVTKQRVNLMCSSTTYPNLKVGEYISAHITLPPTTEQAIIVKFLDHKIAKIDSLIAKQERMIELLQEKRQAVISHAVTKGLNPNASMKDSGVEWLGEVPEHWTVIPLKYLVTMKSGGTPSKLNRGFWDDGDIPWASSKDLKTDNLEDTQDHITQQAIIEGAAQIQEKESVFICVRGMILAHTFPVVEPKREMAINQDLKCLIPKEGLNHEYLAILLRGLSREILGRVDEAAHGTKVLRIPDFGSLLVAMPPYEDQKTIHKYVETSNRKFEQLIASCINLIKLLQERRSALISSAVTGQIDVRSLAPEEEVAA